MVDTRQWLWLMRLRLRSNGEYDCWRPIAISWRRQLALPRQEPRTTNSQWRNGSSTTINNDKPFIEVDKSRLDPTIKIYKLLLRLCSEKSGYQWSKLEVDNPLLEHYWPLSTTNYQPPGVIFDFQELVRLTTDDHYAAPWCCTTMNRYGPSGQPSYPLVNWPGIQNIASSNRPLPPPLFLWWIASHGISSKCPCYLAVRFKGLPFVNYSFPIFHHGMSAMDPKLAG